jgi:hypothetical protein
VVDVNNHVRQYQEFDVLESMPEEEREVID